MIKEMVPVKTALIILLLVLASSVFAITGFWYGTKQSPTKQSATTPTTFNPPAQVIEDSSKLVIKGQQAIAQGQIIKKDSLSITMKGSDQKEVVFKLSPSVVIYPPTKSPTSPSRATSDINDIQLDKEVLITLELVNSEYLVKTIAYPQAGGKK